MEKLSNVIEHGSRGHESLGGSSANRWTQCPGSVFLYQKVPPSEPGEAALLGTFAHEIGETKLEAFLNNRMYGDDYRSAIAHLKCDDDDLWDHTDDYVELIWKNVLFESITDKLWGIEDKFYVHKALKMGGFVDFWCVYIDDRGKRVGVVVDFKYGYHPVSVEKNYQLAFYGTALRNWIRSEGKDLDRIRCVVIQPRADIETYQETQYTAKQIDTWEKRFIKAAEQIYVKKKPKFKTGDHCKWCDAQGICVARQKEIERDSELIVVNPREVELPDVATVPDEVILKVLEKEDQILGYIKAAKAYALASARAGKVWTGWKLVQGKSRRQWKKDDDEEIAAGLAAYGVTDPFNRKLKPLGTIEREVADMAGLSKAEAKEVVSTFCEQTVPGISLVPESDPRLPVESFTQMLARDDD